MKSWVLDTSVAIAWYLPESFSESARVWREKLLNGQAKFLVPSLHYLEFANVIRTYVKRGELNPGLAEEIYAIHLESPLEVTKIPWEGVLKTALNYGATAYDSAYISLALLHRAPLLTGEGTTTPWVVKLGKLAQVIN